MVQWLYSFIMQYKRVFVPGGIYFFTVITYMRCPIFSDENAVNLFKDSLIQIKRKHPFTLDAIVILPDHIHSIWTLPENDANYPTRWRLIKANFSRQWTKNINNPYVRTGLINAFEAANANSTIIVSAGANLSNPNASIDAVYPNNM